MAATKKQQTHAKRGRELAVKERRERKRAKKAERALAAEGGLPMNGDESGASPEVPEDESEAAVAPVDASGPRHRKVGSRVAANGCARRPAKRRGTRLGPVRMRPSTKSCGETTSKSAPARRAWSFATPTTAIPCSTRRTSESTIEAT